jgi:hypothetical protein
MDYFHQDLHSCDAFVHSCDAFVRRHQEVSAPHRSDAFDLVSAVFGALVSNRYRSGAFVALVCSDAFDLVSATSSTIF